mgnify:CR=1 FL=1
MSAENPSGLLPQGPEPQEWQGQRWEYLVVKPIEDNKLKVLGRIEWKFLKGDTEKDTVADFYNKRFGAPGEEGLSIKESLNLLGQDGWEMAGATPTYSMDGTGTPLLFFKRPVTSP